jgi:transcriptional regulator with XRE-family HTH domain
MQRKKKSAKSELLVRFGDAVREARKESGLSQEELADKAGLHRTYIGMIERAEKNITLTNVEKIATALNRKVSQLIKF